MPFIPEDMVQKSLPPPHSPVRLNVLTNWGIEDWMKTWVFVLCECVLWNIYQKLEATKATYKSSDTRACVALMCTYLYIWMHK